MTENKIQKKLRIIWRKINASKNGKIVMYENQ